MDKEQIDPYILLRMYSTSRTDLASSHIVHPLFVLLICHAIKISGEGKKKNQAISP